MRDQPMRYNTSSRSRSSLQNETKMDDNPRRNLAFAHGYDHNHLDGETTDSEMPTRSLMGMASTTSTASPRLPLHETLRTVKNNPGKRTEPLVPVNPSFQDGKGQQRKILEMKINPNSNEKHVAKIQGKSFD